MVFNVCFAYPFFLASRQSKSSHIGFHWDESTAALWPDALERYDHDDAHYTISQKWWPDFRDDVFSFDQDVYDGNPQNQCSVGVFDLDGNPVVLNGM
jgi:hypothetical protein